MGECLQCCLCCSYHETFYGKRSASTASLSAVHRSFGENRQTTRGAANPRDVDVFDLFWARNAHVVYDSDTRGDENNYTAD